MTRKAIIISISGYKLTTKEKKLFKKPCPWGVILFKRNIKSFDQLKKLIKSIKKVTKDKNYPIIIDEEGGQVSRLQNIIDNRLFSQRFFGQLYEQNNNVGLKLYKNYLVKICNILKSLGININTIPVMDKLNNKTHNFLIKRVFSKKENTIKSLSDLCIKTNSKFGIATVIKHMPGHGLANYDSHKRLPVVNKNLQFLLKNDFKLFKNANSLFAMTAHVLYKKIDRNNCATHSYKIINKIIRNQLKYKGILISDDISMKSLKYNIIENAIRAINAGCNLALYCDGKLKDNIKLLKKIPKIDQFTKKKTEVFYRLIS